jgi:streptogramin lyase
MAPGDDECVLYTSEVGDVGAIPRALAIDGDLGLDGATAGRPWVGLYAEEKVVRLDGEDGSVLAEVATDGVHPYGAAIAGDGGLWVTGLEDGRIARVDTLDVGAPAEIVDVGPACDYTYGIATDAQGNVWLGGFACADVLRYGPDGEWTRLAIDASARGVAVGDDGDVWIAHTGGSLTRVSADPVAVRETWDLRVGDVVGLEAVGVAIDLDGLVWAVAREGAASGNGLAFRLDPDAREMDAFEVGLDAYTYSDMTGHALRSFARPRGWYRHVFEGCEDGEAAWARLHWDAVVPPGTTLAFSARRAADAAALDDEEWAAVAGVPDAESPADLDLAGGGVIEVEIVLATTDRNATPRVRSIGVERVCPGPD